MLGKLFRDAGVVFTPLFVAQPHIFVARRNPIAARERATLEDLADLPRLTFDQGANNSFYLAEEILSTMSSKREIRVSDRATIFNLMIGLGGYTISTGLISDDLDPEIVRHPLDVDERIEIGWIAHTSVPLTCRRRPTSTSCVRWSPATGSSRSGRRAAAVCGRVPTAVAVPGLEARPDSARRVAPPGRPRPAHRERCGPPRSSVGASPVEAPAGPRAAGWPRRVGRGGGARRLGRTETDGRPVADPPRASRPSW